MTAKQKIIERLKETGSIDNFWCIDNRITTRLSDVIFKLKKIGWEFETRKMGDTKNYAYYPLKRPESASNSQLKPKDEPVGLPMTYKVHDSVWKL